MKYALDWDRVEFEKADRLVRTVLLQSGRTELRTLKLVTSDYDAVKFVDDKSPEGVGECFTTDFGKSFKIWITPAYTDYTSDLFHDTVLHELCHGYLGLYAHNQRFRRFLARVLYHYSHLVHPIDYGKLTSDAIRRYTQQGKDESLTKYVDRMYDEQTAAEKIAITEAPAVARQFLNSKGRYAKGSHRL